MVIFVCQDNHQPRGQQRTHAFRSGGGGYRGKTATGILDRLAWNCNSIECRLPFSYLHRLRQQD
jgi:hypothetical protein